MHEAVRGLDEQRSAVDTVQQRAGVLLALAAIANLGLGQLAFVGQRGLPLPPVAVVGILAAIAAVVMLFALCWPRKYRFTLPADLIIAASPPFDVPDEQLISRVAGAMAALRVQQEENVNRLNLTLRAA